MKVDVKKCVDDKTDDTHVEVQVSVFRPCGDSP